MNNTPTGRFSLPLVGTSLWKFTQKNRGPTGPLTKYILFPSSFSRVWDVFSWCVHYKPLLFLLHILSSSLEGEEGCLFLVGGLGAGPQLIKIYSDFNSILCNPKQYIAFTYVWMAFIFSFFLAFLAFQVLHLGRFVLNILVHSSTPKC
jgi:hypothetical protein